MFVTKCNFAFPRKVCESASLNDVESTLKSRKRIFQLTRNENKSTVNDYAPLLLLLWQVNMDIQFVFELRLALAHYVSGYLPKAERSNMQDIWQEVEKARAFKDASGTLPYNASAHESVVFTRQVICCLETTCITSL